MKKAPEILHLNLHREFFASIAADTKKTEYRARRPCWRARLEGRRYDLVKFRNGYLTIGQLFLSGHRLAPPACQPASPPLAITPPHFCTRPFPITSKPQTK
jgi:hypothetical protein